MSAHALIAGERPRAGDGKALTASELRIRVAAAFLGSSGALVFISLPIDGYLSPDWRLTFVAIGVTSTLLAIITLVAGRLSLPATLAIALYGDAALVVADVALTDHVGGQILVALFTLPTLFVAMFMRVAWVLGQIVISVVCGWIMLGLVTDISPYLLGIRLNVMLVASAGPAVVVLFLRTQLETAAALAQRLATTDPLTGLLNRRGMEERFPALLARARRAALPIGVLVADLDHFKRVNDDLGHDIGDVVLKTVATAAIGCARGDDLVVRFGGEEIVFVVAAEPAGTRALAERLRSEVEEVGAAWKVTISVGAACASLPAADGDPTEVLSNALREADNLMYEAKKAGRNQVWISEPAGDV